MIGCLLLYPAKDKDDNFFVQHAVVNLTKTTILITMEVVFI